MIVYDIFFRFSMTVHFVHAHLLVYAQNTLNEELENSLSLFIMTRRRRSTAKSRVNYMVMQLRLNWNCFCVPAALLQWKVISFVVSKFGNLGQFTRRRDVHSQRKHVFHLFPPYWTCSPSYNSFKSLGKEFQPHNNKIENSFHMLMLQWISSCFEYSTLQCTWNFKFEQNSKNASQLLEWGVKIFSFAIRRRNSLIAFSRWKRFDIANAISPMYKQQ